MEVDQQERAVIIKALEHWKKEGLLTETDMERLNSSLKVRKPAQQIARYFFLFALSCTLMAFGAIFIDDKLLERLKIYFELQDLTVAVLMTSVAVAWFYFLFKKAQSFRELIREIYLVPGALATLTALVYFCKVIGFGPSNSLFLLLSFLSLLSLSLLFRSQSLWIGALIGFGGFYGSITYVLGNDHRFLGMNYPLRYTILGLLLVSFSFLQKRIWFLQFSQKSTFIGGLLLLFTGLWMVSIFGNYSDLEAWQQVRQTQVLYFAFVFGAASVASLYLGLRYDDSVARDLGILFLLINFYTRYFEYFWDALHKGVFFLFLGISFFLLGRWLDRRRKKTEGSGQAE